MPGTMTTNNGVNIQYVDTLPTSPGTGAITGRSAYGTIPIGSVAYGSLGTSAVHVAGTLYIGELLIERPMLVTNINVLNGATVGTDNNLAAIYDATGNLLANSALAGALAAGANAFQTFALTAPIFLPGPAQYFIAVQCNGTTATTRRLAASTFVDVLCKSQTGTFGTVPTTITPPTTFAATTSPVAYVN